MGLVACARLLGAPAWRVLWLDAPVSSIGLLASALLVAHAARADEPAPAARTDDAAQVEVRGTRAAPPPRDPMAAGSVLRGARLDAPGATAADVLKTEPGLAVQETGGFGAQSTARIRGATSAQTPVYLAGVRLNDDVGGTADLSSVPLWLLDRVEVYRSNAPLDGDVLGIGGAIFFEPRRPRRTEGSTGVMVGSFGAHALWAVGGVGNDEHTGGVLVGARFESAKNDYPYLDNGNTTFDPTDDRWLPRQNAEAQGADLWVVASQPVDGARINVVTNLQTRHQGLFGPAFIPTKRAKVEHTRVLAAVRSRLPCGESCTLATTTQVLVAQQSYDDPLFEAGLAASHVDVLAHRVEQTAAATYRPIDAWWVSTAAHVAIERLASTSVTMAEPPPLDARRVDTRGALSTGAAVTSALTLFGLAAADCHQTEAFGGTSRVRSTDAPDAGTGGKICSTVEPSARAGIEIAPGAKAVAFLANVSRYGREPTLGERYGISATTHGNRSLEAEHGTTFDAGLRVQGRLAHSIKHAFIDAFGFVRSSDNLIAYKFASAAYVVPMNIGTSRTLGADVLAGISLPAGVAVELAATMLDARDTSTTLVNDRVPYLPALIVSPRVEMGGPFDLAPFNRGKVALTYRYEASRYEDQAGIAVIPAVSSFDIEADLAALGDKLVLRARGVDLFDRPRFDFIGYPLPPRSFYFALEAHVP